MIFQIYEQIHQWKQEWNYDLGMSKERSFWFCEDRWWTWFRWKLEFYEFSRFSLFSILSRRQVVFCITREILSCVRVIRVWWMISRRVFKVEAISLEFYTRYKSLILQMLDSEVLAFLQLIFQDFINVLERRKLVVSINQFLDSHASLPWKSYSLCYKAKL